MKKIKFAKLSQTAKKNILHTARDLPFGRFLACVSPSACRQVMEPEVKMGRTFSRDLQIFCEEVSRLCRDDKWAKNYLLYGQSPYCWSHIKFDQENNRRTETSDVAVAERLGRYLIRWDFLYHGNRFESDTNSGWKLKKRQQFSLEFSANYKEQKGLLEIHLSDSMTNLENVIEIAAIIGAFNDWDEAYISRYNYWRKANCVLIDFPLVVPKSPDDEVKELYQTEDLSSKIFAEELTVVIPNLYRSWRELLAVETEKVFRERGLDFVFDNEEVEL